MDKERWLQGVPLEAYIESAPARSQILRRLQKISLPEEVAGFFRGLSSPMYALVITEDWCPNAPPALAVLAHCIELSGGRISARVFKRAEHPDLMDRYLKEGKYRSVPVVAFFDATFQPLGDVREQPTLPEWEGLSRRERRLAELSMDWGELWGRTYQTIIANHATGDGA